MFFYSCIPHMFFDPKKTPKKWQFIFNYDNYITLFTLGVTLIGRSKLPQVQLSYSKCDQSYPIWRGNFDRSLIQNIFKKIDHHLKVAIELKANYHIVLHSVAGACVMWHIFKTSEKPPKSIKVTPFHGTLAHNESHQYYPNIGQKF